MTYAKHILKLLTPAIDFQHVFLRTGLGEESGVVTGDWRPPGRVARVEVVVAPPRPFQPVVDAIVRVPEGVFEVENCYWPAWVAAAGVLGCRFGSGGEDEGKGEEEEREEHDCGWREGWGEGKGGCLYTEGVGEGGGGGGGGGYSRMTVG